MCKPCMKGWGMLIGLALLGLLAAYLKKGDA